MASFDPAGLLVALSDSDSSHSSSSESSSSSDEDESYVLYEILFNEMFAEPPHKRPKIVGYVEEVVHVYSEEELSGVPGVIGCIDGTYINIRCPARKVRSTYINRHNDISMTLQAVCDHEKRFLDVTVGNPSKMHDAKTYRNSRLAARLPQICASGNYHILGDAAYPLRQYLLTPYRDYGKLTSQQKSFNARFSATRVRIENAFGDLKARLRQLLHLDFFVVDKINVFVISCCVLHNLCIKAGVEDIPFDPEDTGSDCTWKRLSHDDRESSGPQTAKETVLRQMGEQKRESVRQKMGLQ
ncbi:hypothetical protein HPB49_011451 [Dermacentor silvarum]|uniref:Uncharacterized protein n=1 Tax=Dermacentor silvarum TaxID=543639 RepID=A0ACB8DJ11_DERSI|nr:hypothetical protein HPB49_011451 [Dermacentor silvarum]